MPEGETAPQSGEFTIPLDFAIPSPAQGDTIKAGSTFAGTAGLADLITKAAAKAEDGTTPADPVLAGLVQAIAGADSVTTTPGAFPVLAAGVVPLPLKLDAVTLTGADILSNFGQQKLPVKAEFTKDLSVTFAPGTYKLNLPSAFSIGVSATSDASTSEATIDCSGEGQTADLVVQAAKPAPAPAPAPAPSKAQQKLDKDKHKLKKAKKAYKKAHGAKKAKLHKKIVKLKKAVKKDKKAVKAGK